MRSKIHEMYRFEYKTVFAGFAHYWPSLEGRANSVKKLYLYIEHKSQQGYFYKK
jgi:hypothetical protein